MDAPSVIRLGLPLVALALVTACQPGPSPKPSEPDKPSATTKGTGTVASPAASPSPAANPPAVQLAIQDAARRTGVDPAAVRVVSVEAREWPNSSLGCPRPGQMYAQVITPGFLIVLEASGQRLEYHSDAGQRVETC